MAAAAGRLMVVTVARSGRAGWGKPGRAPAVPLVPSRGATVTRSGAILPKPVKVSEGRAGGAGSAGRQRWPMGAAGAAVGWAGRVNDSAGDQ